MQVEGQNPQGHQTQFLVMEAFPPNAHKVRERILYNYKLLFIFSRFLTILTFLLFFPLPFFFLVTSEVSSSLSSDLAESVCEKSYNIIVK